MAPPPPTPPGPRQRRLPRPTRRRRAVRARAYAVLVSGSRRGQAVLGPKRGQLVRRRHPRPRRAEPADGRGPDLAHRRGRHPGAHPRGWRPDRAARRLLQGVARHDRVVHHQRLLRHPRPAGGHDPAAAAGPQPQQHHHRHRRHALDGYDSSGSWPDARVARARVHRSRPVERRQARQDPVRAHPPELPWPDHRAGHFRGARGHPVRGLPQLPRDRCSASDPVLGFDGRRRPRRHPDRTAHGDRPVDRPLADPDGVQLPGRWVARRARPAPEALVPTPILQVKDLHTQFKTDGGIVKAVDGVSFDLYPGESLGIVGESGSGKSITALSILRLVPEPGRVVSGQVLFHNQDLLQISGEEIREIRGRDIAMIFQDPQSSLNPVLRTGFQIDEAMLAHDKATKKEAHVRTIELLRRVRIPAPESRVKDFPHQLSGGMRQRAMIAMGLANAPSILIADEPTTALDVTVQAQILELLADLNRELGTAIMMITHNMAVVPALCTRVLVMYAGEIVEQGPVEQIFENPQHPYTWSLLRSIPRVDALRHERLRSIEGLAPDLLNPPVGCRFHPRCPFRVEKCFTDQPRLEEVALGQQAACWVTMDRARKEMDADNLVDIRPGAGSGLRKGELTE